MKAKLIVLLLVILSLSVMLVACGEKGCEDGVHTLDEGVVTKASTCVDEGVRTHTCTLCGETVTKAEPKATDDSVHHYNVGTVTTEPDCLNDGVRTLTCILCGNSKTQAEPATGDHVWGLYTETKAPTCGVAGEKVRTCATCSTEQKTEITPTGLHKFDEGTVVNEATCSEKGTKIRACTNEGCSVTQTTFIPATGLHVPGTEYVATSTLHWTPCKTCGTPMDEQVHVWDEGEVVTPVDGCKSGVKRATCTVCEQESDVTIPSTQPHTSSCTIDKEANKLIYACTVCGEGYTYSITKLLDMEGENPAQWPFKDNTGAVYGDKTVIQSKVVTEANGNNYQSLVVTETLNAKTQVQDNGALTVGSANFAFGFDVMAPSASNDAGFGIQFFNTGTSDWTAGRGQKFLELKGNTIYTNSGVKLADISLTEWTSFRVEVQVTNASIIATYFVNNSMVHTETLSNSMYEKSVKGFYLSGSWQTQGSGYYFDNVLVASK